MLDGDVRLRRTEYDAEAACRYLAEHCAHPDIEEWTDFFVRNLASDVEALRVFSGRGTSST